MTGLVSVIIPVYNANIELLCSCVNSLTNQTYANIEVLMVDDGSTADKQRAYEEIAQMDGRIKVLHQPNQGVSAARNNGTMTARGEYITYVDGDDVVSPIAIEEAMEHITKEGVDLVISGVEKISSHDVFSNTKSFSGKYKTFAAPEFEVLKKHYITLDNPEFKNIQGKGYINRGPYCRLMKKEIAVSNPFPGGIPIGEDLIWNMALLNKCSKVCVVYNCWYGYYVKENTSAIRKYYGNREELVRKYLEKLSQDNGDFVEENKALFGKNIAVELYCILRYELLSSKCPYSSLEKNKMVWSYLNKKPWSLLKDTQVFYSLSIKYKILIVLCELGLWIPAIKVLYKD